MSLLTSEVVWHDDGHRLVLELNRSELSVVALMCPHTGDDGAACRNQSTSCVVQWFIDRYGMECHVGICAPSDEIGVAWTMVGDPLDLDAAQVWVISTTDHMWQAWASTQTAPPD